jgi:acetyl esterase/lipase
MNVSLPTARPSDDHAGTSSIAAGGTAARGLATSLRPVMIAAGLVALGGLAACSTAPDRTSPVADAVSNASAAVRADDDMKTVLDTFASLNPKAIEKISVEEARAQPTFADAVKGTVLAQGRDASPSALVPGVTSRDGTIPGPAGRLPIRVFTPQGPGPFPIIVYFHGGGWVLANPEVYDAGARGLAKQANAVVMSVSYRKAPEAKFPAAWDDALASYRWATTNARAINGDGRTFALAGESAGGNLAVATAVAARDAGLTQPKHVLAVYPVAQTGSLNTPSYIENAVAKPLNRPMVEWFLDKLLRTPADKQDTRLDLVNANLRGLPPVTIINARIDPLRSDGSMLEEALQKAGVSVERRDYTGVTHEFFGGAAVLQKARDAQAYAGQRMMQSFGQPAAK